MQMVAKLHISISNIANIQTDRSTLTKNGVEGEAQTRRSIFRLSSETMLFESGLLNGSDYADR